MNETESSPRVDDARTFAESLRRGKFTHYFLQNQELPIGVLVAEHTGQIW